MNADSSVVPVSELAEQPTGSVGAEPVARYTLGSWAEFYPFVEDLVLHQGPRSNNFVWRGQRRESWALSPSIDRLFARFPLTERLAESDRLQDHLERFKKAVRGRRGRTHLLSNSRMSGGRWVSITALRPRCSTGPRLPSPQRTLPSRKMTLGVGNTVSSMAWTDEL